MEAVPCWIKGASVHPACAKTIYKLQLFLQLNAKVLASHKTRSTISGICLDFHQYKILVGIFVGKVTHFRRKLLVWTTNMTEHCAHQNRMKASLVYYPRPFSSRSTAWLSSSYFPAHYAQVTWVVSGAALLIRINVRWTIEANSILSWSRGELRRHLRHFHRRSRLTPSRKDGRIQRGREIRQMGDIFPGHVRFGCRGNKTYANRRMQLFCRRETGPQQEGGRKSSELFGAFFFL